ncbi:MAG: hypothetical protein LBU32_22055 [Clostridiales bacterium]|jgi:hypothetical protein|nr:hypothetical protein [Clostridiales bacterium]
MLDVLFFIISGACAALLAVGALARLWASDAFRKRRRVNRADQEQGVTLEQIISSGRRISSDTALDWAVQMAQGLNSSQGLRLSDLTPSQIEVLPSGRLIIESSRVLHFSADKYEAPEEFACSLRQDSQDRRFLWIPDARSNIYRLGLILLDLLKDGAMSRELECVGNVISKCVQIDPKKRYQNAAHLLRDLRFAKIEAQSRPYAKILRAHAASAAVFLAVAASAFGGAGGIYNWEKNSEFSPATLILSKSLETDIYVEKRNPSGKKTWVGKLELSASNGNVAFTGGRMLGIEAGWTKLQGSYLGNEISLDVRVVEPKQWGEESEQIEIVQYFLNGGSARALIEKQAGGEPLESPDSLAVTDNGRIYIKDGLAVNIYESGEPLGRIEFENASPSTLRAKGNDLYAMLGVWGGGEENGFTQIVKINGDGSFKELYSNENDKFKQIRDFTVGEDGWVYFISHAGLSGASMLEAFDLVNPGREKVICELPPSASNLAAGTDESIYISCADEGLIYSHDGKGLKLLAGAPNERAFIDGADPRFYQPSSMKYSDGDLYIWDFNTLRRLSVKGGKAEMAITLAGEASPDVKRTEAGIYSADEIVFPFSRLSDIAIYNGDVLLADPKDGLVWIIQTRTVN